MRIYPSSGTGLFSAIVKVYFVIASRLLSSIAKSTDMKLVVTLVIVTPVALSSLSYPSVVSLRIPKDAVGRVAVGLVTKSSVN